MNYKQYATVEISQLQKKTVKGPLNFPNAQFVMITKMIVIKDVCCIAKMIPIDPLVTVF